MQILQKKLNRAYAKRVTIYRIIMTIPITHGCSMGMKEIQMQTTCEANERNGNDIWKGEYEEVAKEPTSPRDTPVPAHSNFRRYNFYESFPGHSIFFSTIAISKIRVGVVTLSLAAI